MRQPNDPSTLLVGMQILSALWAVLVLPFAFLLLAVADTWAGRNFALWALATSLAPWCFVRARTVGRWKRVSMVIGVVWVIAAALVLVSLPNEQASGTPRVTNQYTPGSRGFGRLAPANLLPEEDQLRFVFTVMPLVDGLFTWRQAGELKDVNATVYGELEADPNFHALGSAMTVTYADLLGLSSDVAHSYVYVPPSLDRRKPAPLFVFFHGSGGNFKGYLWVLSKIADRTGFVLVAPSNGMGNWRAAESSSTLDRAIEAASRSIPIDHHRIVVGGLSNGGLAVTQLVNQRGSEFAAVVLISPVFDEISIRSSSLGRQWMDLPVFITSGAKDDRVPASYVESRLALLKKAGARLNYEPVADADHFLIFTHRHGLEDALAAWLSEAGNKR